ncbi:uncharacterized protein FOMMEDRAFT_140427 [Fomitiporia mediterranea MF3/22]|uniref:uncharacterized protein n=1 Tax=Fomitiporia mediterranea (strain MF3/22) TaxID=694068 RepID=UPI0004408CE8|nr:uncharacterized protein FOMMEDRAFT_140427 [Fomitiporia mediterranea MF3/22]EJD04490.1 hypothetical protein FOMMEDRAFT_140427 [Fomitiporia mediterranea MF3/22]
MSTQHRQQPSRLFIPPMLNTRLANGVDTRTMFSPALQTAHQPGFPPLPSAHPFNPGFPLQTPIQGSFFHPASNAPPRQMGHGHRATGSMAQIPSVGMHPPVPMTPFGSQFPPQLLHGGGPNPSAQPFVPKSRRTPSMIGGPPKAALGGPNRKVSPLPPSSQVATILEKVKAKKIPVKIPLESGSDGVGTDASKPSLWSRRPIASSELPIPADIEPPEISSAPLYPDEEHTRQLPPTIDVFLPSKSAWAELKQREIDEKLEKLGIERRSFEYEHSENAYGPRGRASSISSPADPNLLMLKLNKLQQQQSGSNSLATSPQPHSSSISPNPMFGQRLQAHGHSMSLAPGVVYPQPALNGFGAKQNLDKQSTTSDEDSVAKASSPLSIYAPQGRVPAQLQVPSAPARTESRPDFIRGFGLDIPEEEEEEEEELQRTETEPTAETTMAESPKVLEDDAPPSVPMQLNNVENNVVAPKEGTHTRHTSRISVALSLGSVSKNMDVTMVDHSRHSSIAMPGENHGAEHNQEVLPDPLNEWTGSESVSDDQESIGEWSNPSDEERARQERLQRRYLRRMQREAQEMPRRLPEFPKPPEDKYNIDDEDIISNPSDEGRHMTFIGQSAGAQQFGQSIADQNARASRPLPPVPHSRDPSNQYSYYGSLPSHSRGASEHFASGQFSIPMSQTGPNQHAKTPSLSSSRKELNPFAKPFMFGGSTGFIPSAAPQSVPASVSVRSEAATSPAQVSAPTHSRAPSFVASRALNAAAKEFKPASFTFRAPEGVPALSFPEPVPETSRPLPEPPTISRAVQGREKRQRTDISNVSYDSEDSDIEQGHDSMASFRFPAAPEPTMVHARSEPTSPSAVVNRNTGALNASAKPFTFSGFSTLPPTLPPLLGQEQRSLTDAFSADFSVNATRGSALGEDDRTPEMTLPSLQKQKRAPIPLDFKHPVSTNMVPAGLFKNLGTGDVENGRAVRGPSGSLEISDSRSDISLDDLAVPAISRNATRRVAKPEDLDVSEDEFDGASNDEASHDGRTSEETQPNSPASRSSMMPADVASYSQGLRLEDRLETLLDHKLEVLRNDVVAQLRGGGIISSSTDELVREAMAMFRTQLRESAAKGLNDSSMDAGGELDFEMIREIVEQGHEDSRRLIQEDLATIIRNFKDSEGSVAPESIVDLIRNVQDLRTNVLISNAEVAKRLGAIEAVAPHSGAPLDREGLILDIISALTPHLTAIRSEPVDYEGLTSQLSQAVKPHISQLIDLASDKRETAGLIADKLMPLIQTIGSTPVEIDTSSLVTEVTATVSRIIAPIDTHSIKEQVADLVVERLDSRLATRDNDVTVNFNNLKNRITEAITPLLGQFESLADGVKAIGTEQSLLSKAIQESASKQGDSLLVALSEKLGSVAEALAAIQSLVSQEREISDSRSQQLDRIESSIGTIGTSPGSLSKEDREEILSGSREVLARLSPISESIISALSSYETKHGDLLSRLQSMDEASQDVRKLTTQNAELQSQVNKARSQHGLLRVQHDNLASKVTSLEAERDQLRAKIDEMHAAALSRASDYSALEARNHEQERAMHAALDRLKVSDVNAQTYQERISELEKANRELTQEGQQLKLSTARLEMQAEFAARDKESTLQALKMMQEDRDRLAGQQSHWEELHRSAAQIETLANLVHKSESEEIAELKRIRDQSKVLEGEHASLKKRFKDQESKIANIERASAIARENLAQAQQRSRDWETKAREFEGEVERLTTALDQGEQTKNQLETDYSMAKLQLEEKEAESRITKDRERKLEEQIASLKTKISSLTSELEEERRAARPGPNQRPSSSASHNYEPSEPPTPRINGKSLPNPARSIAGSPPPRTSTWDSIHAPMNMAHTTYVKPPMMYSKRTSLHNSRAPSPTPSTVSAVTQGADGWYS